jgi:hypothetical protein
MCLLHNWMVEGVTILKVVKGKVYKLLILNGHASKHLLRQALEKSETVQWRPNIRLWALRLGIRSVYHSAGQVVTYDINNETADAAELEPNTFFLYCLCT